jgi:hypothetical protein
MMSFRSTVLTSEQRRRRSLPDLHSLFYPHFHFSRTGGDCGTASIVYRFNLASYRTGSSYGMVLGTTTVVYTTTGKVRSSAEAIVCYSTDFMSESNLPLLALPHLHNVLAHNQPTSCAAVALGDGHQRLLVHHNGVPLSMSLS